MAGRANIRYALETRAWAAYDHAIRNLIETTAVKRICEVGGGAKPLFPLTEIEELGLDYTIVDVSPEELEKAPVGYSTVVADAAAPGADLAGRYDLIFSRMLAEHVNDPATFHKNIFSALVPGGHALHFFPTLYSLPFVINLAVPEGLSERFVTMVWPNRSRSGTAGKFPALYKWCRGPTRRQFSRFEALGYEVQEYVGFFGHTYYRPILPRIFHRDFVKAQLLRYPNPNLTSYAYIVLRHPTNDGPVVR